MDINVGSIIRFNIPIVWPLLKSMQPELTSRVWKVIKHVKMYNSDSDRTWDRYTLDKNCNQVGDEIILEVYPESPEEAYLLVEYNSFSADSQPLPPPSVIVMDEDDTELITQDSDPENSGFHITMNYENTNLEAEIWEYLSTSERIMQIILQDGLVLMFIGESVPSLHMTIL